jgi:2-desacetyl-2-hydroxyethyl bacteriochlorophyllide A dehydrogenase
MDKTRTIVFTNPCVVKLQEEKLRELRDCDVLVELAVSTISSGTERANLLGDKNVSSDTDADIPFPRVCGYSSSGTVVQTGKKVRSVKPGDRVALSWSTHSKYVIMDEENVHKITDDRVSFSEAALWMIGTFPLAAIRKCALEMGESAIVMGLGVLGLIGIKLLRAAGAAPIVAVDPVAEKRAYALQIGADYAFDPYDADFAEKVRKATEGGANVALEVTGIGAGLNGVLECMAPFGRVALLGCTRDKEFTIDYYRKVHRPGISLIGAHTKARPSTESSRGLWTTHDDIMALQKLHRLGRLDLASLVEEVHSPQKAPEIYQRLAAGKNFPLVQFDWSQLSSYNL